MSTLLAMGLVVIALGMLIAYQLGYSAGSREGFEQGRQEGKREGSVRAYAVGYDRGRHDRQTKEKEASAAENDSAMAAKPAWTNGLLWIAIVLVLLTIVAAVAISS